MMILVLVNQTENKLQRDINALHCFCTENNLTVNTSKSKLMYIMYLKENELPLIEYDLQPRQWVDSFKYPGVTFSASNNL